VLPGVLFPVRETDPPDGGDLRNRTFENSDDDPALLIAVT
jgi:hypothetical protein